MNIRMTYIDIKKVLMDEYTKHCGEESNRSLGIMTMRNLVNKEYTNINSFFFVLQDSSPKEYIIEYSPPRGYAIWVPDTKKIIFLDRDLNKFKEIDCVDVVER